MATPPWSIAEVAEDFGVTHRTVRYYEDQGLVSPERRGTQRLFHPRDRVRLSLVLRGKRLGFALEEIRRIVDMYDEQPGEAGQLRYLIDQIDQRRADLEQRRADIDQTLAELDDVETRCRRDLAVLTEAGDQPPATLANGRRRRGRRPPPEETQGA
ncbi:MAG TPA: MerR family DNA-binding transcriptional regulator [Actinomycetales bacterium]|nr:MerR family DNA-binding transcriptional regulator [Actinomycetales bacterium]